MTLGHCFSPPHVITFVALPSAHTKDSDEQNWDKTDTHRHEISVPSIHTTVKTRRAHSTNYTDHSYTGQQSGVGPNHTTQSSQFLVVVLRSVVAQPATAAHALKIH
jgi:hypothetical protein